jgi:hypothetical protein
MSRWCHLWRAPRGRALALWFAGLLGWATPAAGEFRVAGLFQFGPSHVGVAFTDTFSVSQASQPSHYALTPQGGATPLTIQSVTLQENRQTAILNVSPALPSGATYDVAVTGIGGKDGEPLEPGGPTSFTTATEAVTGIAEVHANIATWQGRSVTIVGQVYMTASSSGGTPSGYIQDGTGRGLNLFGGSLQPASDSLGTVAKVTGTIALYFTTVELSPFTATAIVTRMPHLAPKLLTVAQANSPQWEGTYIQCTATLNALPSPSGANNYTYPAAGDGSAITYRVRNSTGIIPSSFSVGDLLTGAGAGTQFQVTFQITVGNRADFYKGAPVVDLTPPTLVSAVGLGGGRAITLAFNEAVDVGADVPGNYEVFPTANPSSPIPVVSATPAGVVVELGLGASLDFGVRYSVRVSGVEDAAGNVIVPGSTIELVATEEPVGSATLRVPARVLLKNRSGAGEVLDLKIGGVAGSDAVCRIFDLQGRLVKVLFDGRLPGSEPIPLRWDGRDETFEFVRAGTYICHLMTTDPEGNLTEDRAPIVVAVRLR